MRIVVPDTPHHVAQQGNRRERVFFGDDEYVLYRDLLAERCRKAGVACWAYCLMPNHAHLEALRQRLVREAARSASQSVALG